jgi:K+-sensing histidine kinase KdpD
MLINKKYLTVKFSESELRERNWALAILLDIGNFLSRPLDLRDVLDGVLHKILEHFDLAAGRIYLTDDTDQYLNLAAHTDIETTGLERVRMGEGFTGLAAQTRSFILQDVSALEDKERAALLLSKGFRIIICVPLIAMDKLLGVMNLAAVKVVEFDTGKVDLLGVIGNQIAVAASNVRLYEELANKIKEVEEKRDTIKFFAYSALHDLKSPAIGIYGLTKLLHKHYRNLLDERGRRYCDQILNAAAQIEALVERINAYIMAKEAPFTIETIQMKEVIDLIHDEFALALEQRHIRWVEPETIPLINADRLSLIRVLRNLVDNALKYGGESLSEIRIGYAEDRDFHILSVTDDGVGMQKEDSAKVFEIFQRQKTSKGTEGTGLGLAIIKVIAERHRGGVRMEPGAEKGLTFYVSIAKQLDSM